MTTKQLPSGTQDKLFRRAEGVYQLEHQISDVLKIRGFQRIETPMIEFAELFDTQSAETLYRFFDNQGRLLVLRPDMTLPVGRVVSTTKVELPLKLHYSGKVFRYHDEMKGLQNEFTQIGIEIIGFSSIKSEYEAILSAYTILDELDVPEFFIEMGHAKLLDSILEELDLPEIEQEQFIESLKNRNISELHQVVKKYPSEIGPFILELPTLFGDVAEVIYQAKNLLPENHAILMYLEELLFLSELFSSDVQKRLRIDLGMVRSMDYYTGIMFFGYGKGIPDSFLSGGRYDNLLQHFGLENEHSVGWAMNLEAIFDLLYRKKNKTVISKKIAHVDDLSKLKEVTTESEQVEISLFHTFEETKAFAKKWHYDEVWHVDGDIIVKEVL